jgi:hypothetical protein
MGLGVTIVDLEVVVQKVSASAENRSLFVHFATYPSNNARSNYNRDTTRRRIPEDNILHISALKNLKFHMT